MSEISKLNGYDIKDKYSRDRITQKANIYENVAGMKSDTTLEIGMIAKTLGFYNANDLGSATYLIKENLTANDMDIIELDNGLFAEYQIVDSNINIYQFGAKGDNQSDDTTYIQRALDYAQDHDFIEVKGSERYSKISETLLCHAFNKIDTLYLDVLAGHTLTNGYMISVNSENVSTWDIEYPKSHKGYLKHIELKNSNNVSGVNGIFNGANNRYEQIFSDHLNITFKSINSYLDVVQLQNIQVSNKIGSDYAINLGSLGDACKLDTAHMYGTIGTANFITGFYGHNAITLKNIICNGNLNINGGNVAIENIHSESGQITIDTAIVNISNGYFYHNDPNITITNSYVTLNQLQFVYDSINHDYTNSNDIDINITNSRVEINDCYKSVKGADVNEKIFSFVKTNLDSQPTINTNKKYYRKSYKTNQIQCSFVSNPRSATSPQLSEKTKWRIATGTYYYKAYPIIDITRKIKTAWYEASGNATMTNGDKGFRFSAVSNGMWRVYRGTTDGSYDKYVDIAISGDSIQDDGVMCNGYKWIDRTPGAVDSFENVTNDSVVEYIENNIRCSKSGQPTSGTWTKGDIVYKATVGENDPIGWLCIESGTPGTWKSL